MTKEKRQFIAGMGGRAAHDKGTAHQWTSAEATSAGRKGGLARARNKRPCIGNGSITPDGECPCPACQPELGVTVVLEE